MPKGVSRTPILTLWVRRRKVEQYIRRGFVDQREMAAALGVTQNTISLDVEYILGCWQATEPDVQRDRCSTRIKQLEAIVQEAWNAWELSKTKSKEVGKLIQPCSTCRGAPQAEGQPPCRTCGGTGSVVTVTRKTKMQTGDPSYLAVIRDCIKECGRLEGLYHPVSKTVNKTTNVMAVSLPSSGGQSPYAGTPTELLLQARQALLAAASANSVTLDSKFVQRDKPEEAA